MLHLRRFLRMEIMKKAIIIGATSGIGYELAKTLLAEGWQVAACGRRLERLQNLQNECTTSSLHIATMDVRDSAATEVLDSLLAKMGSVDLLLYASGIGKQNPQLDEEIELNTIATNNIGMVRVLCHFLNYVKTSPEYHAKRKAHVAVITSVAGTAGMGSAPAYSASKRMQMTYLSAMRQFCCMEKIPALLSDVRPGFVETDILNPNKHYPMLMSRETAVKHMLRVIRRRPRVYTFDWRFRCLVALWKLIPTFLWERISIVKN